MLLSVQLVVALFVGLMLGIVVASVDTAVKWWEALAAIGTCLTALVAIAIPWWQDWRRDIDARRAQLPRKWAVAQAAEIMIHSTQEALADWNDDVAPVAPMFDAIRSNAVLMTNRILDSVGVQILDDIVAMSGALVHHINVRESGGAAVPENLEHLREEVDAHLTRLQGWKQSVYDEYRLLRMTPPK